MSSVVTWGGAAIMAVGCYVLYDSYANACLVETICGFVVCVFGAGMIKKAHEFG